ncbi:MAG: pitrilysin family protein [Campylobacterota bacterium]|nr:pitrilysin family protein [Campylobacterota bacterium]
MSATIKTIKHNGNEIPLIFEQHKTLPIFNLQLVFKNSGYINDGDKPGLASITAKVLNEGTKKEGSVKFARKLENKAISISANNGFETFVIEVSCLKDEYQEALKYLLELLNDPNITNKTLEKIKTLQLSKLKQKEDDFDYVASNNLKKIVYKDTPLEHPSSGTLDSINNMKLEDVKNNINSLFNMKNLIVAAGGDIDHKQLQEDMKVILDKLSSNKTEDINKFKIAKDAKESIIKKETEQSYIYFASPFDIDANSKENYKAKVASFVLGGSGFGSRLMEEIRVKHGLAYSAYGHITNKKSHSYFTGYLQTKLDNTKKAKNMVKDIVDDFVKEGVTKKELEAAKKFLLGSEPLRTETFSQRLNRAFMLYYKGLPLDHTAKELELINNLTLKDLNKFIKSHKEIKNLSFSIVTK